MSADECSSVNHDSVPTITSGTTTELCAQFLTDTNLISLITAKKDAATPCACAEYDMTQDAMFEKVENCYGEWLFNDGVKQKCCYRNGKLLAGYPDGGFVILDGMKTSMDVVRNVCCHGNNRSTCAAFYDINQSDDCTRYGNIVSALSWGDPLIQTVGSPSYNYSFNGHGEYIFLKSSKGLEIQARTDYLVPGNNDSTIFTAFAFTNVYINETLQVLFNRPGNLIDLYLNNGVLFAKSGSCTEHTHQTSGFSIVCLPNGFKIIPTLLLNGLNADVTTNGKFMSIEIKESSKQVNMTGLAGNVKDGKYCFPNGSSIPTNSSERDVFEYGDAWSLTRWNNSSLFNYTLSAGDFSYHNTFSRPRFLEDLLNNLTALFGNCNNTINITSINATCRNSWEDMLNKQCLLIIARTCNISFGEDIQKETERQHMDFIRKNNKPPSFKNAMPNATDMLFNGNTSWTINLREMVVDDNLYDLRFEVDPWLDGEMNISADGEFTWKVGTALRNIIERALHIAVFDTFNLTNSHIINFRYCGCERPNECNFQSETADTAECKCPNRFVEGKFCENKTDLCSQYICYQNDTCNKNYSGDGSPCAKCPKKGFYEENFGFTQFCQDLNECNDTRTHNCEQECFNDVGSYHCGCKSGYLLNNDNSTCADVDECVLGNYSCTNLHEACVNLPGNYTCGCESGFSKNNATSPCVKLESQMYFGFLEYIIHTTDIPQTNDSLQGEIATTSTEFTKILNRTNNFMHIEIYKIYKSLNVMGTQVHFDFVLHMSSKQDRVITMKEMGEHLKIQIQLSSLKLTLDPPTTALRVQSPNEGGICDVVPKRTNCLEQSTHCINREIDEDYYSCECNAGFKKPNTGNKRDLYCDDINECEVFKNDNTTEERCVHGEFCLNTYGSWNCTCPKERLWMSVGTPENPVYRCQGNHSYLGSITLLWDARKEVLNRSVIESFLATQIEYAYKDPSMESTSAIHMKVLFVSATILGNTSINRPAFGNIFMLTYEFRIRLGDPVSTSRLQQVADKYFKYGTTVGYTDFQNVTIYNESDNILCKRSNNGSCDMRTTVCEQVNGTTKCKCKPGYSMHPYDSHACQDVDECNSGYMCIDGTCENKEGNWTCKCPLETSLVVLNETVQNCSAAAFNMCTSTETPYRLFTCRNGERICENSTLSCRCYSGYFVNGSGINSTCTDLDECSSNPCGNGTCGNTIGSFSCDCNKGFILNKTENTCIDIDECLHPDDICVNGKCSNNNGNYTCTCHNGFYEQFSNQYVTYCTDINECTNASYSCDGICTNQQGSFTCACPPGFHASGDNHMHFMCTDFDECANSSGYQCIHGTCSNTNGSWDCACGFSSRPLKLNNSVIECIEIYRYPMQFEVQEISLPGGSQPPEKEIENLLIKQLTDILNTSQSLGGKVQFPVELLPNGYHHPSNGNITFNVTVILSTMFNDSALKAVFQKSNPSQRTIVAGSILVISFSKSEIYVDQCNLHSKDCDFNSTVCVFDKSKGRVSCQCRTGYKDVKYHYGVGICEPVKESKEEFAYVATVSITIEANTTSDNSSLRETIKQQITYIYQAMFPNDKIWVELVRLLYGNARTKR
ncbi:uncharacterized protein LOC127865762 [Dreissena polymorpha]|uniref:uncharacterized protein LOC127865762 n=1 Tax=Dreissena polymorpha TaxID=45954 RepID=UPI0022655E13|nr:uncharacterized protein LOC127865762 [Dreissena polymorpha]